MQKKGRLAMKYRIPYGKGEQVVDLPEAHVAQVLLPPTIDQPHTVEELMEEALAHPIGTPLLEELISANDKVVLIVSDITRAWARFDLFLPILADVLMNVPSPPMLKAMSAEKLSLSMIVCSKDRSTPFSTKNWQKSRSSMISTPRFRRMFITSLV